MNIREELRRNRVVFEALSASSTEAEPPPQTRPFPLPERREMDRVAARPLPDVGRAMDRTESKPLSTRPYTLSAPPPRLERGGEPAAAAPPLRDIGAVEYPSPSVPEMAATPADPAEAVLDRLEAAARLSAQPMTEDTP